MADPREMITQVGRKVREHSDGSETWATIGPDLADAILAALSEAGFELVQWQPIETAPKDGTHIILGWFELPGQKSMHVAFWNSLHDAWCQVHGLFTRAPEWQPTHWMPLPAPPPSLAAQEPVPESPPR